MVDRRNMPVEDLIRSQLQSEEKFTDQRLDKAEKGGMVPLKGNL